MVRQNGERIVHFDAGEGVVCWMTGANPESTTDAREITCGVCLRTDVWKQAWKDAARKVAAP